MNNKNKLPNRESWRKIAGFLAEVAAADVPEVENTIDNGIFLPPDQYFYRAKDNKEGK